MPGIIRVNEGSALQTPQQIERGEDQTARSPLSLGREGPGATPLAKQ